ncbi:alpha/beta hydrolase [Marinobacter nanhaiticus D15-8W]|uniref:Alpha/beta hydrolase n=1 Tax=Marinobacter nanhaiticus D15-8W TaxID=626887 RepID=N6WVS1_9GAMM|nr:alpha/beta hydrolase [Marinobacter nanhaiticus]ENO15127.2 alpha/beta hydrolase [Marinobacter nanhaiticus D15-8W]
MPAAPTSITGTRTCLVLLVSLLMCACTRHINAPQRIVDTPDTEWTLQENRVYTPADWPEPLHADIYLPQGPGPHPAVLTVHGGGWERRSPEDMEWIAEELASNGFAVMNVEYRFAPQYRFPAQLHDLQQAMHWLNDNAERLDIDADRLAGFGYSSGAHLVSLLALVASEGGELDEPYGGPETRLDAVVSGGTPSDLRKFDSGELVVQFLGDTKQAMPDRYAAASPVTHVTPQAPPFFLFHGGWDSLVPLDHATDFQATLAADGVATEMMILRWRGHILTFLTSHQAVDAAIQFLYRQLELTEDLKISVVEGEGDD